MGASFGFYSGMKILHKFLLVLLLFLTGELAAFAKNSKLEASIDSLKNNPTDTLISLQEKKAKTTADSLKNADIRNHSARKAALFSTVVPGLGQAYNKKYWKIPVVYAGFGAMAYLFSINNSSYNKFKKALIQRYDGDSTTIDNYQGQYNDQSLIEYQDYYRRNRDLSVIGFALFYVLNIVDASVDANLYYFDVSDDLSLQWSPLIMPSASFASGISLKLKF